MEEGKRFMQKRAHPMLDSFVEIINKVMGSTRKKDIITTASGETVLNGVMESK